MTVNRDGGPRLPYDKFWPDQDQLERLLKQAQGGGGDPMSALRDVLSLIYSYQSLVQKNFSWEARQWGQTDIAENTSEHWQYLRNSDLTQLTLPSTCHFWPKNAAANFTTITTNPYGIPSATYMQNLVGTKNWIQQSCSATGNTWYSLTAWCQVVAGSKAGFEVIENSGSVSGRTHAVHFPAENVWRRIGDHRNPGGLVFRSYKGTSRLCVRCIEGSSVAANFAQIMLEKGRRPHPWRQHFLDRGNLITSLKTAGSASFTGNITLSASGVAAIRQVSTKKFIIGATGGGGTPATSVTPVSATGAVGTGTNYARQDHVHRGVRMVRTAGSASADGALTLSASGGAVIRQIAATKFVWGAPKATTSTPPAVSGAGYVGVGVTFARADHTHRGVRSIRTAGSASVDGAVMVSASGTATIRRVGQKFIFGASGGGGTPASSVTPVSGTGAVGVSTNYARQDHVHRGVRYIQTPGSASVDGAVLFSGSGGARIRQSGQKFIVGAPTAFSIPWAGSGIEDVSTSANAGTWAAVAPADHHHKGVRSIRTAGSASCFGNIIVSGSGAIRVRQLTGAPRKFVFSSTGIISLSSATPAKVSSAGTVGVGTTAARSDHIHRGVTSIFKAAGASADGRVGVVASGGASVQVLASNLRVYAPAATAFLGSTPNDVSSTGYAGVLGVASRGDHTHRGVRAIKVKATGSADGLVQFSASTNAGVRIVGRKVIFQNTGTGSGSEAAANRVLRAAAFI